MHFKSIVSSTLVMLIFQFDFVAHWLFISSRLQRYVQQAHCSLPQCRHKSRQSCPSTTDLQYLSDSTKNRASDLSARHQRVFCASQRDFSLPCRQNNHNNLYLARKVFLRGDLAPARVFQQVFSRQEDIWDCRFLLTKLRLTPRISCLVDRALRQCRSSRTPPWASGKCFRGTQT